MTKISEAITFANDRPMSLDDDLYQWAVDAEELIRKQDTAYATMRSLLIRWLNDTMTAEDVRLLEQDTIGVLKDD